MKTSKLISILQELDPSGQLEVVIDNCDITFADKVPGYYDGHYQVIQYDDKGQIAGIQICAQQDKIRLYYLGYEQAFWDFPDLEITYDSESSERRKAHIEKKRAEIIKECEEIDSGKYDPKTCKYNIEGCYCNVGWSYMNQCPDCRDSWEKDAFRDSYCICPPKPKCSRCNGDGFVLAKRLGDYCPTLGPCPECSNPRDSHNSEEAKNE